jgi:hypothetical protein
VTRFLADGGAPNVVSGHRHDRRRPSPPPRRGHRRGHRRDPRPGRHDDPAAALRRGPGDQAMAPVRDAGRRADHPGRGRRGPRRRSPGHPRHGPPANDSSWLVEAGIPALLLGPGDPEAAHVTDEWLDLVSSVTPSAPTPSWRSPTPPGKRTASRFVDHPLDANGDGRRHGAARGAGQWAAVTDARAIPPLPTEHSCSRSRNPRPLARRRRRRPLRRRPLPHHPHRRRAAPASPPSPTTRSSGSRPRATSSSRTPSRRTWSPPPWTASST